MYKFWLYLASFLRPFNFKDIDDDHMLIILYVLSFYPKFIRHYILNKPDYLNYHILYKYANKPEILEKLIKLGSNVNLISEQLYPVNILYKTKNPDSLHVLLKYGVDYNFLSNDLNVLFSTDIKAEVIKILAKLPDFNMMHRDSQGRTALFRRSGDVAKAFIENGIDVNAVNHNGQTALFFSHYEPTQYFISQGADVNIIDNEGNNALFYDFNSAYDSTNNKKRMLALLNAGIDYTVVNNKGFNAFYKKSDEVVDLFIDYGVPVPKNIHQYELTPKSTKKLAQLYKTLKEKETLFSTIINNENNTLRIKKRL